MKYSSIAFDYLNIIKKTIFGWNIPRYCWLFVIFPVILIVYFKYALLCFIKCAIYGVFIKTQSVSTMNLLKPN